MRVISHNCVQSTRAQHFTPTIYEHTSNIPSNLLVTEAEGEYAFVSRHRSPKLKPWSFTKTQGSRQKHQSIVVLPSWLKTPTIKLRPGRKWLRVMIKWWIYKGNVDPSFGKETIWHTYTVLTCCYVCTRA